MTIFEQMVLAMRKAQKEYYRTETPELPFGK